MENRTPHSPFVEHLENRTLLADFALVSIPDTQYLAEAPGAPLMNAQTQWVADNALAANIRFAAQQGDLLRRGYSDYQAGQAHAAFAKLDGIVPYTLDIGNHDYDNQFDDLDHHVSSANFTKWFGDSHYQGIANSGLGGSSLDQRNRYQIFSGEGQQYMVLSLEWEAPDSAIAWAQGVINSHRQIPVILTTHEYLSSGSGRTASPLDPAANDGQDIFTKLVAPNQQIFLVLSGHVGATRYQTSTNNAGTTVIETVGDDGGVGRFQLFTFSPSTNKIRITTYAPDSLLGDTSLGQTEYSFNFSSRFSFAAGTIGNDDTITTPQGIAVAGNVFTNDSGTNLAISSSTNPANGTLMWGTAGAFTYTPNAGYHGNDTFTYTLSGGNTAKVTIQVNSAPTATADIASTTEGAAVVVHVTANDTDADAGDVSAPTLKSLPAHGAVFAEADGTFTYTPDPKYAGGDSFTYVVSDGNTLSAPATVSIAVMADQAGFVVYDYPEYESTVAGDPTGSYLNLQATDGVLETIAEVSDSLDQQWRFDVTGGTEVTVCINAWRASGPDEYALSYSTNGTTWNTMTQIVPASSRAVTRIGTPIPGGTGADPAEPYQMWLLPSSTRGTVWIRAVQDPQTGTEPSALAVDELFIRSTRTASPYVIHISVDGLRSDAITTLGPTALPNFYRLRAEGAFTDNARNDYNYGETLPNHTDEITARPVSGPDAHNVAINSDDGSTVHAKAGSYVYSVYDVAHDNGLRTAMYAGKDKFAFFDRSWNATYGAADTTGADYGKDKIDAYVYNGISSSLTSAFTTGMAANPFNYTLLHWIDPDVVGHASGWMSDAYLNAVQAMDTLLGQVLSLVESNAALQNKTSIILTADHGGTGTGHADATNPAVYTIPFYAWGPGITAGADLYQLNSTSRTNPGAGRLDNAADPQPIRHGDASNLSLELLGLPSIPKSLFDAKQDLTVGAQPSSLPPTAAPDAYNTNEDASLTVSAAGVLANDTDPEDNKLAAIVVTSPAHGSLSLNGDGSFSYTPAANFAGTDTFTYRAFDGISYSEPAPVTITVSEVNDAPVAVGDSYTTIQNVPLTVDAPGVLQNDFDVEGPMTAVLGLVPANGTLTFGANGSFTYTPNSGFYGTDTFTYKVNDGLADSAAATVSITVTRLNHAPVANPDSYATNEDSPITGLDFVANDTDVDNDPLTVNGVVGPSHGELKLEVNGTYTYTPAANFNGADTFTYKVTDGLADSNVATVTITIEPVNDAPHVVTPIADVNVQENAAPTIINLSTVFADIDAGDGLTYSVANSNSSLLSASIAGSVLTLTYLAGKTGTAAITVTATDASGVQVSDAFQVTVSPAPVDQFYTTQATAIGTSGTSGDYQLLTEALYTLPNRKKTSRLEHSWTFENVRAGSSVSFFVEAFHTVNTENDHFVFAYSTDGTTFTDMLTVTKTTDDEEAQSYVLPAGTSGTITIRVKDTNATVNATTLDGLYVDQLFIQTTDPQLPQPVLSIVATDPLAAEAGRDPAEFTISRSGDTSQPVMVPVTFAGAAGNLDYELFDVSGSAGSYYVTLGVGVESAPFSIVPIDDDVLDEGTEDVLVTIGPVDGYTLGAASATATIADNDGAIPLPTAPTGLASTSVTKSEITLSWTDNSDNETGFIVERLINGAWTQVGVTNANVSSFTDTGLTASTLYSYRVKATNASGDSAYSNILKIRTARK